MAVLFCNVAVYNGMLKCPDVLLGNQAELMIALLCIGIVSKAIGCEWCVVIVRKHKHLAANNLEPICQPEWHSQAE
jgi:hypothetical protein